MTTNPAGHPPSEHPHDRPRAEPSDGGRARRLVDNAVDGIQRSTFNYGTTKLLEWIEKLISLP